MDTLNIQRSNVNQLNVGNEKKLTQYWYLKKKKHNLAAGNQNIKQKESALQVIEITVHQGHVKQQEQNQMTNKSRKL